MVCLYLNYKTNDKIEGLKQMDETVKERLRALIEAKKQGKNSFPGSKKDIYQAQGKKRKGIKQRKQGGLFDK